MWVLIFESLLTRRVFTRRTCVIPFYSGKGAHVTVHSFFIEYISDETKWNSERITKAKVDLNDLQALGSARNIPLLTIAHNDADRYRVGYIFTVYREARYIAFYRRIPRPGQNGHFTQGMGDRTISPPKGQYWDTLCLTDFVFGRSFYPPLPGKYKIRSRLLSNVAGKPTGEGQEKLGDITWRIDLI